MVKNKNSYMGDGRYSYSFGNGTNLILSKKPNKKIESELRLAFSEYAPSKSRKNLTSTFNKFSTLQNISQHDPKAPKKYTAFRMGEYNKKTGKSKQVIVASKGMFK